MADLSGHGMTPTRMRLLGLLVILGVLQVTVSFHCPKVMNQALIADPKDCRKYYHCLTDGRFFVKSCPNGLVFEPKAKVCVWDSSRSCIPEIFDAEDDNVVAPMAKHDASTSRAAASNAQKSTTTDSQKTSKKTVQTNKSAETSTAKVEQTTSASKQTTTEAKTTVEAKAPKQTESVKDDNNVETSSAATTTVDFSTEKSNGNTTETTNTTDMRASENPTDGNSTESSDSETDETSTPLVVNETTESFKTVDKKEIETKPETQTPKHSVLKRSPFEDNRIDRDSGKVQCTSAFAYVTDPDNCHTFYHCNNWRPFQKKCPPGLFFDSQNLVCNWPHNVNCIQGYRAKTYFSFNNMRRRMHPQTLNSINNVNKVDEDSRDSKVNNINKAKTTESTTEKIPFLETIENDVRKVKYDEDVDSTTAHATEKIAMTVRSFDRYGHRLGSSAAPETSSVDDTTTTEKTTTTESTTQSTPSTSADSWVYETRASETRSTWKDWNFDLFYTSSDKQGSELDRLELFSNGKKAQAEKNLEALTSDGPSSSSTSSSSSATTGSPSSPSSKSIWDNMSEGSEDTTIKTDSSTESDPTTTSQAPSLESETSSLDTNATITTSNSTSLSNVTLDDINDISSASNDTNTLNAENSTTTLPKVTSRAPSFDFGSAEERERSHPRKIHQDAPPASNPFLASDRFAANQQSMYAKDYHSTDNVEDVEIEKFMMKMLNDAMQSKHMVARQASEEYPDNMVDATYDKMAKETEIGGSDVFDKWAIADKEGKKSKGTLVEETETEAEEIESSGEVEVSAYDTENTITNLIMKDEAKPAEPETTKKPENVVADVSQNETETEIVNEVADSNTTETKETNSTTTDIKSAAPSSTTTESTTTSTTTQANVNETTTVTEPEAVNTSESVDVVTKEEVTVKAVPLLKDVSDLCTEKNNCSATAENKTEEVTVTAEPVTTEKVEVTETEDENKDSETTTVLASNATESANVTEKAETESTTTTTTATTTTTTTTTTTPTLNVTETVTTTTAEPIAKDAAGKSAKDDAVPSDNAIFKDDKVEVDDKHRPLSVNATKEVVTIAVTVNLTEAEPVNTTEIEIATNTTESEIKADVTNTTTVTEIETSTSTSNDTESEQTTVADDTSEDVTESTSTSSESSKMTSTLTEVIDTSSTDGKLAIGGSKGTTKKSFISLSDLIKWYLRHWRHYSRWRDSKEVRPVSQ
ncbi:serine-rich adhesin for platelets-like [Haliotis asinina]|uniref:serine-rich adhesin for platelets-like n=1 Tax=Haliotis asinina TaxID=109174 RepID=UPI003531B844